MKIHTPICAALLAAAPLASAQWETTTYTLKGGWNAIHLSGSATYDDIANLLPPQVEEVWRWNPNPTQVQFTSTPLLPSAGTPEWSVWKRLQPEDSTLSQLTGQASYLVKCSGTTSNSYTLALRQSPMPPANQWVRNGANLLGFPAAGSGASAPFFNQYFATFPIATVTNARIFKYVGGELGAANPMQVFSPAMERLDRTQAYWFSAEVTGNFTTPIEINLGTEGGLAFGRTGSQITAQIRNRTAAPVTLTFAPTASEAAPTGQTPITGSVPLTLRTFNTTTLNWEETPIASAFQQVVAPQQSVEIRFGINRTEGAMADAPTDAFFASILRVTDGGNLMDVRLPVSATRASLAGLWIGDITLTGVDDGGTPREFPLRTLLHVSDDGTASLLSKVFLGKTTFGEQAVCTDESLLDPAHLATARRLVATHLPLDRVLTSGTGSVEIGGTLVRTVQIPFDDPTNPFVHQYHPDHDNKNPRGQPLPAGVESYHITRTCTFNFTATPPEGSGVSSGWGSSVIGGEYQETITGLKSTPIVLSGTFELRRASELGTLLVPLVP